MSVMERLRRADRSLEISIVLVGFTVDVEAAKKVELVGVIADCVKLLECLSNVPHWSGMLAEMLLQRQETKEEAPAKTKQVQSTCGTHQCNGRKKQSSCEALHALQPRCAKWWCHKSSC